MSNLKCIIFLIFICLSNFSFAGNTDLKLTMDIDISDGVKFMQTGNFSVTLTNNGPDDAGIDSNIIRPIDVISFPVQLSPNGFVDVSFQQDFNIPQDCFFITVVGDPVPGGTVSYAYDIAFPPIPVNKSITCYGTYHVGFEQGFRIIKWRALESQEDTDIDIDNNRVEMFFGIKPQIIPTLSNWSLVILFSFVLLIAYFVFKRNLSR